ncbi:MAG: ribonuclease HII [Candidatus Levybacteria bacterium]|nr:ribonuclease HII [Candidatus Levybacteria bacterium]
MKKPTFKEEQKLWKKNCSFVIGVDEVGRGAFAGPVVAGAVIFKKGAYFKTGVLSEINDSKLLNSKKREVISKEITKQSLLHTTSVINLSVINKFGIGKATQMAIRKAIKLILWQIMEINKGKPPIFVLADGFHVRYIRGIGLVNQKAIIKGDQKSISIAAASIIAKVYRDKLMRKLNKKYPGYGFSKNKGYGTKKHREALKKYGLSKIHRKSFNLSKFL